MKAASHKKQKEIWSRSKERDLAPYSAQVCSAGKQRPWQPPQLLLWSTSAAAQWLTSCAVRGTSSWQLMHAFSFLISPSRLLAGLKVVIIANSGHVVSSGCLQQAGKTLTYAASAIKNEEFNHSQMKNCFLFGLWSEKALFFSNRKDCRCENVTKEGTDPQITETWAENFCHFWFVSRRWIEKAFVCVALKWNRLMRGKYSRGNHKRTS